MYKIPVDLGAELASRCLMLSFTIHEPRSIVGVDVARPPVSSPYAKSDFDDGVRSFTQQQRRSTCGDMFQKD